MRSTIVALAAVCICCSTTRVSSGVVVGLWRFDEASGNATDGSGNGNVGTFVGSNATRSTSKPGFGNALTVANDYTNRAYIQVPGNFSLQVGLNSGDPWSVTAWAL